MKCNTKKSLKIYLYLKKISRWFSQKIKKKNEGYIAKEFQHNKFIRDVQLHQEYFDEKSKIIENIQQAIKLSVDYSIKANIIKEKYKKKICNEDVKTKNYLKKSKCKLKK